MEINCGQADESYIGKPVELKGWCRYLRDHGGKLFIDLADRYGLTQLVFDGDALADAKQIGKEYAICVSGRVRRRDDETIDRGNPTGMVEIYATKVAVINKSELPPFEVIDEKRKFLANEELRLRYRYLDLRRREMIGNIEFRDRVTKETRRFFWDNDFLELETPMLVKDTYETGSRTFLVPSRVNHGRFYSLPQSPQVYKQMAMISGLDRYFQMARCFRDEDPREDRQPEFMQIDFEACFRDEKWAQELIERLMKRLFREAMKKELNTPFKRMDYRYAMENYGSDKPDLRFGSRIFDVTGEAGKSSYNILKRVVESGGKAKAMAFPAGFGSADQKLDRNYMLKAIETAKSLGLKGLTWLFVRDGRINSDPGSIASSLGGAAEGIMEKLNPGDGDIIILCSDPSERLLLDAMGKLRKMIGDRIGLYTAEFEFLWVDGFPLFETDEVTGKLKPAHNPFSSPTEPTLELLDTAPEKVSSRQFDLVLNGVELGSGSVRIRDAALQRKILNMIGMTDEAVDKTFGFLLEALKYGAPDSVGMGLGFDRIVAMMRNTKDIREFILFPKNKKQELPIDGSPTQISGQRLDEDYGIKTG